MVSNILSSFSDFRNSAYNKVYDYAEDTSHAFLGESKDNPSGKHNVFERGASHLIGYSFSPLRYGMEKAINYLAPETVRVPNKLSHSPRVRSVTADRGVPIEKDSDKMTSKAKKFRAKMNAKKEKKMVKKEVKKDVAKALSKRGYAKQFSKAVYRRPAGPARPRRGVLVANNRRLVERVYRPPVVTRYALNPGSSLVFAPARRPGCMRMVGKMRIGSMVGHDAATGLNVVQINDDMSGTTDYNYKTLYCNAPWNRSFSNSTILSIMGNFQRFHIRTRLEYVPSCPYTTPGSIQVAYITDPWTIVNNLQAHLYQASAGPPATGPNFTSSVLASIAGLREFPVTARFKTGWRYNQGLFNMTGALSYDDDIEANMSTTGAQAFEPEQYRQQIAGVWVFAPNAPPTAALLADGDFIYGDWFVYYDVELCDVVAPQQAYYTGAASSSTTSPSSTSTSYAGKTVSTILAKEFTSIMGLVDSYKALKLNEEKKEEKKEEVKIEKKEDVLVNLLNPRSCSRERK